MNRYLKPIWRAISSGKTLSWILEDHIYHLLADGEKIAYRNNDISAIRLHGQMVNRGWIDSNALNKAINETRTGDLNYPDDDES